jgi:hypothetical protein
VTYGTASGSNITLRAHAFLGKGAAGAPFPILALIFSFSIAWHGEVPRGASGPSLQCEQTFLLHAGRLIDLTRYSHLNGRQPYGQPGI